LFLEGPRRVGRELCSSASRRLQAFEGRNVERQLGVMLGGFGPLGGGLGVLIGDKRVVCELSCNFRGWEDVYAQDGALDKTVSRITRFNTSQFDSDRTQFDPNQIKRIRFGARRDGRYVGMLRNNDGL